MRVPGLSHPETALAGVVLVASYLALVRWLRRRNLRNLARRYASYEEDPYSMDYKTAFEIFQNVITYEFPSTYAYATQFALIKSYAVAHGTRLLARTSRLTSAQRVGKRAEDTVVLLSEILVAGIDSDRGCRALSKINWLHRQYQSYITNDEMIYTLALFILEPLRWGDAVEWRKWTDLERVAIFTYWREIGHRMGMSGIPETIPCLQRWAAEFADKHAKFADSNVHCTTAALNLFLRSLPAFLRGLGTQVCTCFVEEHVRPMIGLSHPHWFIAATVQNLVMIRAFLLRNFFLPRLSLYHGLGTMDKAGRVHRHIYAFEPWYVSETAWSSLKKFTPGLWPGSLPGPEFASEGYLPEEVGPHEYVERSKRSVIREAEQMAEYARKGGALGNGCPFAFSD